MSTASDALLMGFDQEMLSTHKLLECLPEQIPDFKPHPKSMPLNRLAGHVADLPHWASDVLAHTSFNVKPVEGKPPRTFFCPASREEAVSKFDALAKEARAAISRAGDRELAENWALMYGKHVIFSLPRAEVVRSIFLNHLIHHRAQLGVYLRLLDIPIPGMYGPSADTGQQMMAELEQHA